MPQDETTVKPSAVAKVAKLNMQIWAQLLAMVVLVADACVLPLAFKYTWAASYMAPALAVVSAFLLIWKVPDLSVAFVTFAPALIIWINCGYPLACLWVFMLAIIGGGAYVLRSMHAAVFLAAPALAFGISFAVTQNVYYGAVALLLFPAAYALYFSVRTACERVATITWVSGTLALSLIAGFALLLFSINQSLSADALRQLVDEARDGLQKTIQESVQSVIDATSQFGYNPSINVEQLASEVARAVFNLLPGILFLLTNIVGWCVQPMPYVLLRREDPKAPVPLNARAFFFGPLTGVVYIVCQLPTFFEDIGASNATIVCANIALILMPGLCLSGLGIFFSKRIRIVDPNQPRRGTSLPFITFIVLLGTLFAGCSISYYILILFALYGALQSIVLAVRMYMSNHPGSFSE